MEPDLEDFLRQLLNEQTIQKMKEQKITLAVLGRMTDKDLTDFLPKIGDRVSLKIYLEETYGYVKTCSTEKLVMLLRFCTGSDIIIGKKITVRITPPMSAFSLCPVAHTCGCVLELSRSYDNFLLLREHLENVLDTKVLRMDIV